MSCWVVSQGEEFYSSVWHHPDMVAVYTGDDAQWQTALEGVAISILDDRLDDDCVGYDVGLSLTDDLNEYFDSDYKRIGDYWEAQQTQAREMSPWRRSSQWR